MNIYLIELKNNVRQVSGLLVAAKDSKQCRKLAVDYSVDSHVGTIAEFSNNVGSTVQKIATTSAHIKEAAVISVLRKS